MKMLTVHSAKYPKYCTQKNAEKLEQPLALLPKTGLLTDMLNVKGWLTPAVNEVSGVSRPLHYKFTKSDQEVNTFYKGQHNHPLTQLSGNFLSYVPDGRPTRLVPDYSNIDCVVQMRQITNLQHMFKKPTTLNKWIRFYDSIEDGTFDQFLSNEETRDIWILDYLPKQTQREQFDCVIPEVIRLMDRETEVPEVR
jgi:hypothetical protein